MQNAHAALFTPTGALEAFGAAQAVSSMLAFEREITRALAQAGVIQATVAERICAACDPAGFDAAHIVALGVLSASPAVTMVAALKAKLHPADAAFAHVGATSQDVIDTAQALMSKPVVETLLLDAKTLFGALCALATQQARTPMLARTLLQSASVTSVGFVAAGWAAAVQRGIRRVERAKPGALRLQWAGAVGTSAQLRAACVTPQASQQARRIAAQALGLSEPAPWHTHTLRDEWLELALAVAALAASLGKIATDWALLTQFEVSEIAIQAPGQGASSAMPHKRNPVACAVARGAALQTAQCVAAMLQAASLQEHQRALGTWQAELAVWPQLLCAAGASAQALCAAAKHLTVDAPRMLANIHAVRAAVDSATADQWFDANLANDAGELTEQLLAEINPSP